MDAELVKILAVLLTMATILIGPSVYYLRFNANKNEQKNSAMFESMQKTNEKAFEKIENSQRESNNSIKSDLKEFRTHLESRFSEVHTTVDVKIKELKEQISKELEYSKLHISTITSKVDSNSEKAHNIEKDLLRLENILSKEYITKEQLEMILQLNNKK